MTEIRQSAGDQNFLDFSISSTIQGSVIATHIYIVDGDRGSRLRLMHWAGQRGSSGRPFLSGADFVSELPHLTWGICLIDVQNTGGNGFDTIGTAARARLSCPVIAMSETMGTEVAVAALKRGAVDFLVKPIELGALHEAVAAAERILDQRRPIAEQAERDRRALDRLNRRERQVLTSLASGKTSKGIAEELGISVRTVEAHRAFLMDKLEAPTAAAAVSIAIRYETGILAQASLFASSFEA